MAITERYVTTTGAGTHDGTSEANAYNFSEMVTAVNALGVLSGGVRYNIKSGTYTNSVSYTITKAGTQDYPIIFRGYFTTIGDLDTPSRTFVNGPLTATNFPVLDWSGTSATRFSLNTSYHLLQNLYIKVDFNGNGVFCNDFRNPIINCRIENQSTGVSAGCVYLAGWSSLIGCDLRLTGASGGNAAIEALENSSIIYGCYIVGGPSHGIITSFSGCLPVVFCTIVGHSGSGIFVNNTNTMLLCSNCTIAKPLGGSGSGILLTNSSVNLPVIINCQLTDQKAYGINCGNTSTAVLLAYNRTRDNITSAIGNGGDWVTATTLGHLTSGSGVGVDYVDNTNGNFNLISTAVGKGAGQPSYLDIGAYQRQESASAASGSGSVAYVSS